MGGETRIYTVSTVLQAIPVTVCVYLRFTDTDTLTNVAEVEGKRRN